MLKFVINMFFVVFFGLSLTFVFAEIQTNTPIPNKQALQLQAFINAATFSH